VAVDRVLIFAKANVMEALLATRLAAFLISVLVVTVVVLVVGFFVVEVVFFAVVVVVGFFVVVVVFFAVVVVVGFFVVVVVFFAVVVVADFFVVVGAFVVVVAVVAEAGVNFSSSCISASKLAISVEAFLNCASRALREVFSVAVQVRDPADVIWRENTAMLGLVGNWMTKVVSLVAIVDT
jgi:hypothetical protein